MENFEKDCHDIQVDDKLALGTKTYCIRCRLCRKQLFVSDRVKFYHSGKSEGCGNCIFLDEDFIPDWIECEIENSSWTKGRLKCPRAQCTARVGGFDFIQGLLCGCGKLTIPAIWIQDGKVDVRTISSSDCISNAKLNLKESRQSYSEDSSSATVGDVDSNDVSSKPEDFSRHQFPSQVIREVQVRKNSCNVPSGQPGYFDQIEQGSFYDTVPENTLDNNTNFIDFGNVFESQGDENISSLRLTKKPFCQEKVVQIDDTGFQQSIDWECVNFDPDRTEVSAELTEHTTSAHLRRSTVKHRKCKGNRRDALFLEHNMDRSRHHSTKAVKTKVHDNGTSSSAGNIDPVSNRFEPLLVEEPAIVKPSNLTNPDSGIQEHLMCAVCLDYFYKPYQCPCSHVFCEPCLRQLYHNRAGKLKCPICRSAVKYIEPANEVRQQIRELGIPGMKQRELFENTAKYRAWPLPPIGPLPFLRRRKTLVPKRDQKLVILAAILLLVVCYAILYILP